ncbi:phosphoribosyltransferase [Candidatus Vecturithrix granuli]|uniref:Phosphoribosyltransferase n=1 Tax=Vecturithrix granuli TaxID=1499967 RepID=A0A0S6WBC7_VECG1|nr:phosphoribosyltransferase [Candidatus Vecturithrix granuli]
MCVALTSWLHVMLDFIFPARCVYCHHFLGDERVLIFCRSCWQTMPVITTQVCPQCGHPFSSPAALRYTPDFLCGMCRKSPPYFDRAFSAAYYDGVMKEAILQFKFQQKIGLGKPLVHELIAQIPNGLNLSDYDFFLPVPLHKTHQKHRGYNQAAILATYLARHYHVPLLLNNLVRIREIKAQSQVKGRQARKDNVKNAFRVREPQMIDKRRVILVDDVFTTGATVNECSKMLKQAGASVVLVLTLSRVHFGEPGRSAYAPEVFLP